MSRHAGVGQKLRLNVLALEGEAEAGRFLVCVDGSACVSDLAEKVRGALQRNGIGGHLGRLLNGQRAVLPADECASDVLRDGEGIIAILSRELLSRSQPPGMSCAKSSTSTSSTECRSASRDASCRGEGESSTEQLDELEEQGLRPPGPGEVFEEDVQVQRPLGPRGPPGGCWEVSSLTPKLREFIATRFCEAASCDAPLEKNFIVVTMRPPGTAPVQYSLARVDVVEFERLCGRTVESIRRRQGYFERARGSLTSTLLRARLAPGDYASNLLPYRYRAGEEFEGLLAEVHANADAFGQAECFRPVILVDTSGAAAELLPHLRASLKRLLYSFLVAKSRFNLARAGSEGRALLWERAPVPPTAQKLREAEEWLDGLEPLRGPAGLLAGLRLALRQPEADAIYVVSSGLPWHEHADHLLGEVRAANVEGVPIHVVGIDCGVEGELGLRELARQHGGTFRQKRFKGTALQRFSGPQRLRKKLRPEAPNVEDGPLSIGGQMGIIDIMSREQEVQLADWLEEQKCANRLLLMTASQSAVPTPEHARAACAEAGRSCPGAATPRGRPASAAGATLQRPTGAARPPVGSAARACSARRGGSACRRAP